jgi:serine/threonine protein kinase
MFRFRQTITYTSCRKSQARASKIGSVNEGAGARGGIGRGYRADDLKLGQPVALNFLPAAPSLDPMRRERSFAEVRITRQLAHPNICRVYDLAEVNGQHFLSMEFIDGEDLASLLKWIGYLSNEKALDIARQLLCGLAAAHERGVLHRDQKPSDIMIDGHGRVLITDFGLVIATQDLLRLEARFNQAVLFSASVAGQDSSRVAGVRPRRCGTPHAQRKRNVGNLRRLRPGSAATEGALHSVDAVVPRQYSL